MPHVMDQCVHGVCDYTKNCSTIDDTHEESTKITSGGEKSSMYDGQDIEKGKQSRKWKNTPCKGPNNKAEVSFICRVKFFN